MIKPARTTTKSVNKFKFSSRCKKYMADNIAIRPLRILIKENGVMEELSEEIVLFGTDFIINRNFIANTSLLFLKDKNPDRLLW